jgi:hypothetical protein
VMVVHLFDVSCLSFGNSAPSSLLCYFGAPNLVTAHTFVAFSLVHEIDLRLDKSGISVVRGIAKILPAVRAFQLFFGRFTHKGSRQYLGNTRNSV